MEHGKRWCFVNIYVMMISWFEIESTPKQQFMQLSSLITVVIFEAPGNYNGHFAIKWQLLTCQ